MIVWGAPCWLSNLFFSSNPIFYTLLWDTLWTAGLAAGSLLGFSKKEHQRETESLERRRNQPASFGFVLSACRHHPSETPSSSPHPQRLHLCYMRLFKLLSFNKFYFIPVPKLLEWQLLPMLLFLCHLNVFLLPLQYFNICLTNYLQCTVSVL